MVTYNEREGDQNYWDESDPENPQDSGESRESIVKSYWTVIAKFKQRWPVIEESISKEVCRDYITNLSASE